MKQWQLRLLWLAHVPFCAVGAWFLASIHRPAPFRAPPPPGALTRWHWFDRCVRVERWQAPSALEAGSFMERGSDSGAAVFTSGYGVVRVFTTWSMHSFDFWQFNLIPAGLVALTLSVPAGALQWIVRKRRVQAPPGLCPACGYDCRATPDRCPECGTVAGEYGR